MAQRLYLIKDYDTALVAMPKWPITGLNQPPVWKNRQHTARTYCPNIYIYIYCPSTTYFFWMENIRRHRITIMWHWTVCADVFSKPYWQVNRKRAHVTFPFPSPNTVSWPQRRRFDDVNQQGVKLIWEVKFRPFLITHLKVDESIKGLLLINLLPVVIFLQLL